jgi:hypothetical protein
MPDRERESKPKKEDTQQEKLHDLPPRKDIRGGTGMDRPAEKPRTTEIDFMKDLD